MVSGDVRPLSARECGDETAVEIQLAPVGSCLLVRSPGARSVGVPKAPEYRRAMSACGSWPPDRVDPNALTRDYCSYRLNGSE